MPEVRLSPTSLSQYIRFNNCERFLRFNLVEADRERYLKRWGLTIQPLTPLLTEAGAEFEKDVVRKIVSPEIEVIDLSKERKVEDTINLLKTVKKPTVLYQAYLTGNMGGIACTGQSDIIHLSRDKHDRLHVHIADVKATRKEKTEHRVQVSVYSRMMEDLLHEHQIPSGGLSVSVLTMRDDGGFGKPVFGESTFNLETYYGVLNNLVYEDNSVVHRVLNSQIDHLFYHLSNKCDGCLFNAICMYDSAERKDLCLTPLITAVEKRCLQAEGISTVEDLAGLMRIIENGRKKLEITPGKENIVEKLKSIWPIGGNLDLLVQRARKAVNIYDKHVEALPYVINGGFGNLPSDEEYPQMVKVFIDTQRDYLQDRLYMASGLIKGPHGTRMVQKITEAVPSAESEKTLLIDWVKGIIEAIAEVSPSNSPFLHFYCYDRVDQKVLLEALKRNLFSISQIPAFFDLLTQTPALTQSMVSFLADEVRNRLNMGRICTPLHNSLYRSQFSWQDDKYDYYNLFRARLFDNRRNVIREKDGKIKRIGKEKREGYFIIESASRFNSQIPLEYAYAAWGKLPQEKKDKKLLGPFVKVNLEMLNAFGKKRVEALAAIEASIKYKARQVEKFPIILKEIIEFDFENDFARSLGEFLFMEHHTRLQQNLISYSLPIEQRVQNGLALLLRCVKNDDSGILFSPIFSEIGLDPELAFNANKLKENDWVLLNEAIPKSANQIKHGMIATIEAINKDKIKLHLLNITFRESKFRYFHQFISPEVGKLYTIDPMSDDINADKVLESLNHTKNNEFFQWLMNKPPNLPVSNEKEEFHQKFIDYINSLIKNRGKKLTSVQVEAIKANSTSRLLLIQGPPGTGKTYTLAWLILARLACAYSIGRGFRVLISCKTHNAINVELQAIAEANRQIGGFAPGNLGGPVFSQFNIFKVVNNIHDPLPAGVKPLEPRSNKHALDRILNEEYLLIGSTPGGAYNLMKYRDLGGNAVDWQEKPFDMVVIDEASQMSIPESVLAGAFLKQDGFMIVVGDHRQMPPIIAHPWKEEQKRSVTESEPYISLFEYLASKDFPCIRLDESFRLHKDLAEFLRENIYAMDGILFHSKRIESVPQIPHISDYVDAVMNPGFPIIVVEHNEQASQQYNETELALAKPIIESCVNHLSLDGKNGIGVVVPHRAQKALLRMQFPELAAVNSIDTVERFQGDERDVIIVSATASDPDYVLNEADFLLNLNRLNVAISRPRKKLIVIASQSVINILVSDLDIFDQSVIWKRLFRHYTNQQLLLGNINGFHFSVNGKKTT